MCGEENNKTSIMHMTVQSTLRGLDGHVGRFGAKKNMEAPKVQNVQPESEHC